MTHPKYKIVKVTIENGERREEVVSKELMFKCDAQRVVNYKNSVDQIRTDNLEVWWQIEHKDGKSW